MLAMEVRADDSLARKINALRVQSASLNVRISQVVRTRAFDVLANAKALVPISTGALRRSIQATFYDGGLAAIIGSYLPYAARQEFDMTLDHHVRPARRRVINTKSGKPGSVIKGTGQSNPAATWGFMRKSLRVVKPYFLADLREIVQMFGEGWTG